MEGLPFGHKIECPRRLVFGYVEEAIFKAILHEAQERKMDPEDLVSSIIRSRYTK